MRMLIADDDTELREAMRHGFAGEGMIVDVAKDGERASFLGRTNNYDIIILDLIMPDRDGCAVCTDLRRHNKTCPILMVSVNATTEQKVRLLDAGADDYVTKPFSFKELLARVRALARRPIPLESETIKVDDLLLDIPRQRVTRGKRDIYLTRKEFLLLEFLIRRRGQVVSRGIIMEHVWNAEVDPFSNTIEAHILNIRKKIGDRKRHRLVHTVPGRGYKIDATT